jgi:hypothetical protein
VKIGDDVPINYVKGKGDSFMNFINFKLFESIYVDKKSPVIKKDEEYPSWVMNLNAKV